MSERNFGGACLIFSASGHFVSLCLDSKVGYTSFAGRMIDILLHTYKKDPVPLLPECPVEHWQELGRQAHISYLPR